MLGIAFASLRAGRFIHLICAALIVAFATIGTTSEQAFAQQKEAGAWSGYGDTGYAGRPTKTKYLAYKSSKSKKAAYKSAKTKKSKYAKLRTKSKTRQAAYKAKKSKQLRSYAAGYGSKVKQSKQAAVRKAKAKQYAALNTRSITDGMIPPKSLTGGGVRWVASSSCLNGTLISVVQQVASSYGALTVSSTCRSRGRNASVGGAKRSHHLTGDAVDFRVHGNWRGAIAFLRGHGSIGGFKHYGGGLFHIDTGPKRSW
jgi:hypothetical protein